MRCPKCRYWDVRDDAILFTGCGRGFPAFSCANCKHVWLNLPPAVRRAFAASKAALTRAARDVPLLGVAYRENVMRAMITTARRAIARAEGKGGKK